MKWIWWLDGCPVNSKLLIREAQKQGYKATGDVYFLTDCANYLRREGRKVEQWEEGE